MGWFKNKSLKAAKEAVSRDRILSWDEWVNIQAQYRGPVDPMAFTRGMPESQILSRLGYYTGYDGLPATRYGSSTYVVPPGGLNLSKMEPWGTAARTNSCGSFLEDIVVNAFLHFWDGALWSDEDHKRFIISTNPPEWFGPCRVLADKGWGLSPESLADLSFDDLRPWGLCQSWNEDFTSGHTWCLVRAFRGRLLILESNVRSDSNQNGPGWWGIGDLKDYPTLGSVENYLLDPEVSLRLPTVDDILKQYPNTRVTLARREEERMNDKIQELLRSYKEGLSLYSPRFIQGTLWAHGLRRLTDLRDDSRELYSEEEDG